LLPSFGALDLGLYYATAGTMALLSSPGDEVSLYCQIVKIRGEG